MKKDKKNILIGIGIISALILTLGYFQFSQNISNLSGRGLTNEIIIDTWDGRQVELQAAHWGGLTSDSSKKIYSTFEPKVSSGTVVYGAKNSEGVYWWNHKDFCNDNDGSHTINNDYSISEDLILSSSKVSSKCCSSSNYVKATVSLPRGTIKAICNANAKDRYDEGWAECRIGDVVHRVNAKDSQINKEFEVVIDGEKDVEMQLRTYSGCTAASSEAELIISFEETTQEDGMKEDLIADTVKEDVSIIDKITNTIGSVECSSNIQCQELCGTNVPTCEDNACFCGGSQIFIEKEGKNNAFYLIPLTVFGLVALIVWQLRKKPKRK